MRKNGLNADTIAAVIDPDEAENRRECTVSDLLAAIFLKGQTILSMLGVIGTSFCD